MKKSKINLVISREDYQKYEKYFYWLKISAVVVFSIFLVTFIVFFVIIKGKNDLNNNLLNRKAALLNELKNKNGDEAKVLYIQQKYSDLNTFLQNDAFSAPYYSLLTSSLKQSTESSTIQSFEIDKSRAVSFTIAFSNFNDLLDFFKFIESQSFLKNFENIVLKNFNVVSDANNKQNYALSFTGKFINLNK